MHAIADRIVDEYLTVVEAVEDDIDEMENSVFTTEKSVDIEQIYLLKREILGLRRAVTPLTPGAARAVRDAAPVGARGDPRVLPGCRGSPVGGRGTGVHLRRDADHTGQRGARRGHHPAERGHAEDLGLGGDRPGAHRHRRHLRDELRAHAGAELDLRLSRWRWVHRRHCASCCSCCCAGAAGCRRSAGARSNRTRSARRIG